MPQITLYHEIQYQYLLLGGFAVQTRFSFFSYNFSPTNGPRGIMPRGIIAIS